MRKPEPVRSFMGRNVSRLYFEMYLRLLPLAAALTSLASCAEVPSQSDVPSGHAIPVQFVEAAAEAGLGAFTHETGAYGERLFPETMGSGVAFIDYDADGWPDLLAVGGATWPRHGEPVRALWLFRNNGDGTFADVTDATGLGGFRAHGFGLAVADYDLDGDFDFLLTTVYRDLLFRNDEVPGASAPARRFTEVAMDAGVDGGEAWGTSASFFQADADAYPDLYVANYVPWTPETDKFCSVDGVTKSYCTPLAYDGIPGRFYHNNGDGTFSDWTERAGFGDANGRSLGAVPLDYDEDGWTDLMVTNDALRDLLYHNDGNGHFTEVALYAGVAFDERGRARAGMGVDAGVVDTTGFVTVFVGNFSNETLGAYRYSASGVFQERAAVSGLGRPSTPTLTFGLLLFDADMDGDLDLFTANGHVQDDVEQGGTNATYRQPPHLFLNDGHGNFRDVVPDLEEELAAPLVARGVAKADYDRDGDVDLVISENGGPLRLWRNGSTGHHFFQAQVVPAGGAPAALGARVELFTSLGRQERFVRTAHSYLSASDATLTFGLREEDQIDSVRVTWHGGHSETWGTMPANQLHRLIEGTSAGTPLARD